MFENNFDFFFFLQVILMKSFSSSEESSNKLEKSKVKENLKEVMDRQCSITFTYDSGGQRQNSLQDFFMDEIDHAKKLLDIVRTDMDASFFENNEVRLFSF